MFPRHDDEEWEDVILRPPPQKKSREQRKTPHDLMAAVSQNKLPGKKQEESRVQGPRTEILT